MPWIEEKGESVFRGQWMRVTVHCIGDPGEFPDEWYVTCRAVDIDCFKLQATKLEAAKREGLMFVYQMMKRYKEDVTTALRSIPPDAVAERTG